MTQMQPRDQRSRTVLQWKTPLHMQKTESRPPIASYYLKMDPRLKLEI